MSNYGAIIGGIHELGADYLEHDESPAYQERRSFNSTGIGYERITTLTRILITTKSLASSVIQLVEATPAPLYTAGGKNSDGSLAARVNWGLGFVLQNVNGGAFQGSSTLYKIDAIYQRTLAEVFAAPPENLVIGCADGICTLTWHGDLIKSYVSGLSACTTGLTAERETAGSQEEAVIKCNGVEMHRYSSGAGDGTGLAWSVSADGNTLSLIWNGATVDSWVYSA